MFSQIEKSDSNLSKVLNNKIGIQIGNNFGYLKDLNFSVLNYNESGLLYSLDYINQKPNGKGIFNADIDFSLGKLKSKASEYFTSDITLANLEVSYIRLLAKKENQLIFFLGGQYNSYLQILDWNDFESFSFLATHGIGVKGLLQCNLNSKHTFKTSLFIPVFQNLVRPPYNAIDETIIENQDNTLKLIFSGKLSSFNTYFSFDWKLNYVFEVAKRFDLTATYLVRYQKVSEINTVKHLQNQITFGANFKF